ncbi:MAG: Pr6Pr family membrane protein [Primorskyibacter sp.]
MSLHRGLCLALALAVAATLITRIGLTTSDHGEGIGAALWRLYRFFTIWTNTVVGIWAALVVLGKRPSASFEAGLLLSISAVAIVYHTLLAGFVAFQGLAAVVDDMFHTFIPIAYAVLWLVFGRARSLRLRQVPVWLIYPLAYCGYAMMRGASDGVYPYFFLDLGKQGVGGVVAYVIGLLMVFAVFGGVIVGVGRVKHRLGLA